MRKLSGAEYAASKYIELKVDKPCILFDFLLVALHGISKNKIKDIPSFFGLISPCNAQSIATSPIGPQPARIITFPPFLMP